jgi:ElaB/YqjD/DUF883 family membrane-anchored ribosome-binding protein
MINPSEDDFVEDEPLGVTASAEGQSFDERQGGLRRAAQKASSVAGDKWEQTKEKASAARDRTEFFLRENPIPTIIGALTIGLAIGWALRYATARDEKEVEVESPLGNLNWSYLSLPFLWPFLKSVKGKYEDSAEAVKDGVDRLKDIDVRRYTKPIRKRWKTWRD